MARTRASQAASAAFGKVGTVSVPADTDGVEAAQDTPATPLGPEKPAEGRTGAKEPKGAATPPPGMSKARLQRHVAALDNAFGKAAAALADYEDSMEDLAVLVADVRRVGFPEHLITAAAARKNMEIPPES
jgi:hypothetical protein